MGSLQILLDKAGNPVPASRIKFLVSNFSKSYTRVMKKIISNSNTIDEDIFRVNVATLMPSFGMTRVGVFHGLKIVKKVILDPKGVLDTCWNQVNGELQDLKKLMSETTSNRSRAILELSLESRKHITEKAFDLFDKLKWTSIKGSDVGRVGASKILFAVLPELALPVDNSEWDNIFRTDNYGKVLSSMIDEVTKWEAKTQTPFETLDSFPTTIPSIYNVIAMDARP